MRAAKQSDWKTEPLPAKRTEIPLHRSFTLEEIERIRQGLIPEQMEDKWFIYWNDGQLYFHRSWTGFCVYIVRFADHRMINAHVNREPKQYSGTDDDEDRKMISYLIDVLLLKRHSIFPTDEPNPESRALMTWSQVGRAMFDPNPPDVPTDDPDDETLVSEREIMVEPGDKDFEERANRFTSSEGTIIFEDGTRAHLDVVTLPDGSIFDGTFEDFLAQYKTPDEGEDFDRTMFGPNPPGSAPPDTAVAVRQVINSADVYLKSTFYEQLVEHVFVSEVLQEAWYRFGHTVEVLRSEIDSSGYDVVFECNGLLRHIQLKTSGADAKASSQKVNIALASKPSGCVVWIVRHEERDSHRMSLSYRFFGGKAGRRLPSLRAFKTAKHTKGNALGIKGERPLIRVVPKSRFNTVKDTTELVGLLFGLRQPVDVQAIDSD